MRGDSRYSIIVSGTGFLVLYLLFMVAMAVLFSYEGFSIANGSYIPALAGFVDIDTISYPVLLAAGALLFILTIASVYYLSAAVFDSVAKSRYISLMFAILALINSSTIVFSGASVAILLVVWSIYFMFQSRNEGNFAFIPPFLASAASLFYPYIFFGAVLCIFYILMSKGITFRMFVASIIGALFPYLLAFSLRYILFEDNQLFWELFRSEILDISFKISAVSVPEMLQMALLVIVALNSVRVVIRSIRYYKVEESSALSKMIVILIFFVLVSAIYPAAYRSCMPFIALPLSILVCEYVRPIGTSTSIRGGIVLVLLIIMVVAKINMFV